MGRECKTLSRAKFGGVWRSWRKKRLLNRTKEKAGRFESGLLAEQFLTHLSENDPECSLVLKIRVAATRYTNEPLPHSRPWPHQAFSLGAGGKSSVGISAAPLNTSQGNERLGSKRLSTPGVWME
ncbi:hypothetical protein EYF80_000042 [Liparis tanakae]|uniref:Uncharacterized protein n=1 Tax=Liparis tanakae TaxID=230148 RepID=A0A4Z2JGM4_9TELE|nr:hypothetical protein EYF80_000042 [Liparis tanakae]